MADVTRRHSAVIGSVRHGGLADPDSTQRGEAGGDFLHRPCSNVRLFRNLCGVWKKNFSVWDVEFYNGGAFNWHLIFLLLLRCTCFKCIFIGTFSHHVCVHPARPSCTTRQIEHRFHSGRSLPIKYFLTEIFEITTALALLNYRRIRAYYKIVNAQPNAYWKYSRAS